MWGTNPEDSHCYIGCNGITFKLFFSRSRNGNVIVFSMKYSCVFFLILFWRFNLGKLKAPSI